MLPSTTPACKAIEPFALRHVAEIEPQPAAKRWLIEHLWLQSGVGILGGSPKVCKTFLAAELAHAVATGSPAIGHYAVKQSGPVLFYGAEDSLAALRVRFDGLAKTRSSKLEDLPLYFLDVPALRLDREGDLARLRAAIDKCRPLLLVLDPFIRIARVDENSAADVSAVLGSLREIQRDFDLAVLLVHHARKSPASHPAQALRGSSDFAAWSDSNLYLTRRKTHLVLYLEHRSAAAPDPLQMRLVADPAPHLVVLGNDDAPFDDGNLGSLQSEIVTCLTAANRPMPTVELRKRLCKRKEDVVRALADLQAEDRVRRTPRGWQLSST